MAVPPTKHIIEFNKAVLEVSLGTGRAVAGAVTDGAGKAWKTLRDSGATVAGQARAAASTTADDATKGAKQVAGQARAAVSTTADDATKGAKQVAGQARAQGKIASRQLGDVVDRTAQKATAAVDPRPGSGTSYEDWTRSELYERAKELDIDGRSSMSKKQLIAALRSS